MSEKHLKAAEELVESRIDSMCMTWDHSFGLLDDRQKDYLRKCFRQVALHDLIPFIKQALATAEREGMRRGAEIVDAEIGLAREFGPHHIPVLSSVRKVILSEITPPE